MAITIELWADEQLVDGAESWWDDVERWLASTPGSEQTYPLLSQVDPYGFVTLRNEDIQSLKVELEQASLTAPAKVVEIVARLIELCQAAAAQSSAELRFVGD